jgi:hypothetical protein
MSQFAVSLTGFYPYLCRKCKHKTFHFRPKQAFVSLGALAMMLLFSTCLIYVISPYTFSKPARSRVLSLRVAEGKNSDPAKLAASASALISLPNVLTNEDILEYSRLGTAPASLSWLIRSMPNRFKLDSKSLGRLKQAGVAEEVIRTMTEVTPGVGYQ